MDATATADQATEIMPADWVEVRIIMPPGADVHGVVDSLVAAAGLQAEDWCEWRGPDGALASIGPCPAPRN